MIQHCHCSGFGGCCGVGVGLILGLPDALGVTKKKKKVLQATTQVCSWLLKWTVGVSELSPLPMESAATSVECQN